MAVGVDVVVGNRFQWRGLCRFHSGERVPAGPGQQVGRAVPERMLSFVVFPFEEFDPGVAVDRTGEIPFGIVNRCGQHVLCQPGADAQLSVASDAGFELLHAAIRKCNVNHFLDIYRKIVAKL